MSKNVLRQPEPEEPQAEPKVRKRKSVSWLSRLLTQAMNVFGIFDRNQIVRSMPYILFCSVLICVYIGNSYYAERIIREIDKTKTELKERKAQYISTMSELMYQSNQSEVARALEPLEIKENRHAPGKLFITEIPKK